MLELIKSTQGYMQINHKARSFVAVTIIVALLALLLRFAIEAFVRISIRQNESIALGTLKLIAAGLENYAKNNSVFPPQLSVLAKTAPPYLDKDYVTESPIRGYIYSFERLELYGYKCTAVPEGCDITGKQIFTVTTGGVVQAESCAK